MPTPHNTADADPDLASRMHKLENMLAQLVETIHAQPPPSCFQPQANEIDYLDGGDVSPTSHGRDDSADIGGIDGPKVLAKRESIPSIAAKFAVNTGVGPPLDDELASSMTYLMSHSLEEKVLEETSEKYHAPSNCELVDTPKVNATIWENLSSTTHGRDLKLQRFQKALTKGINAFASSWSQLLFRISNRMHWLCFVIQITN